MDSTRILFVCFGESPHAVGWVNLLKESQFDVRIFSTVNIAGPVGYAHPVPDRVTYLFTKPKDTSRYAKKKTKYLFPFSRGGVRVANLFFGTSANLFSLWLKKTIVNWQPHVVHSLRLTPEAVLTLDALTKIERSRRPKWIVSSWGQELNMDIELDLAVKSRIQRVLAECDCFLADCMRDYRLAIEYGLGQNKIPIHDAIPGNGGIDLSQYRDSRTGLKPHQRRSIVVSRARESLYSKTLPLIEALGKSWHNIDQKIDEIHFLNISPEAEWYVRKLPSGIRQVCRLHREWMHQDLVTDLLLGSRIVLSPSISDGTPNSMLEAMAAGALPVMSPIESIREWITDGRNGLLASALDSTALAEALVRGSNDDDLVAKAASYNWKIVSERANRELIRTKISHIYEINTR